MDSGNANENIDNCGRPKRLLFGQRITKKGKPAGLPIDGVTAIPARSLRMNRDDGGVALALMTLDGSSLLFLHRLKFILGDRAGLAEVK